MNGLATASSRSGDVRNLHEEPDRAHARARREPSRKDGPQLRDRRVVPGNGDGFAGLDVTQDCGGVVAQFPLSDAAAHSPTVANVALCSKGQAARLSLSQRSQLRSSFPSRHPRSFRCPFFALLPQQTAAPLSKGQHRFPELKVLNVIVLRQSEHMEAIDSKRRLNRPFPPLQKPMR
jgi:hypothetical protein